MTARVVTPLGPATAVCPATARGEPGYLVMFDRREYSPERWAEMTHGGPCMYKVYKAEEVQAVEGEKGEAK